MRLRFGLLLAALLAGAPGCGNRVTGLPARWADRGRRIQIEMSTSAPNGTLGQPLTVHAVIRNAGLSRVYPIDPCPVPHIRIYGRQGEETLLRDPRDHVACIAAACCADFPPGSRWDLSVTFDGWVNSASGDRVEAQPGTYRAMARLSYYRQPGSGGYEGPVTISDEISFTWR